MGIQRAALSLDANQIDSCVFVVEDNAANISVCVECVDKRVHYVVEICIIES